MNAETGHLMRLQGELKEGYDLVPEQLHNAVTRKLNGKNEAYVSLTSGGKLSKWASSKRQTKKKMAKQSRKNNRRK